MGQCVGSILSTYSYWKLPKRKGNVKIEKKRYKDLISDDVTITYDKFGVPHISGKTKLDVFFGQGWAMAQDRLVAMDITRRVAKGTLAEVKPVAILVDRFSRTMGFHRAAVIDLENVGDDVEKMIKTFIGGINGYLNSPSYHYPIECILGYPKIHNFTVVDILAATRVVAWQMNRGLLGKFAGLALDQTFGRDHPLKFTALSKINFDKVEEMIKNLPEQNQGSNTFVISGKYTKSGKPILESDTHLLVKSPSVWYRCHLKCDDFNANGFAFAGMPGITLGYNGHISYGITLSYMDMFDLYVHEINPNNPLQYKYDGEWKDFIVKEEKINVKNGKQIIEKILIGIHGPVMSNVLDFQQEIKKEKIAKKFVYALRSTCLDTSFHPKDFFQIVDMCAAKNFSEFATICKKVSILSLYISYADNEGNIGMHVTGAIPKRSKKAIEIAGSPLPGWSSEYSWSGYETNEYKIFNPKCGFVVLANHDVWQMKENEIDRKGFVGNIFCSPSRAIRIRNLLVQLINKNIKITWNDMLKISNDQSQAKGTYDDKNVVKFITSLNNEDEMVREVAKLIYSFDGHYGKDSISACVYQMFSSSLLNRCCDKLGLHDNPKLKEFILGGGISSKFLEKNEYQLVGGPIVTVILNRLFKDEKDKKKVILDSVKDAIKECYTRVPISRKKKGVKNIIKHWRWGAVHHLTWEHAVPMFKRGPYETGGSWLTPAMEGWYLGKNPTYDTMYYASMKYIVDLSNRRELSFSGIWPGNSCHSGSEHFDDGIDLYLKKKLRRMWYHPEDIKNNTKTVLKIEKK